MSETDLGVNFFLDENCLGQSRSRSAVKLLQELNPEVQGDYFPKEGVSNCSKAHTKLGDANENAQDHIGPEGDT